MSPHLFSSIEDGSLMASDYVFEIKHKNEDANCRMVTSIKVANLPVYIYGTGGGARLAAEYLSKNGVEIVAFADRPQFFSMGDKIIGKTIIDIRELLASKEKIVLCVASMDTNLYKYVDECSHITFCSFFVRDNHYEMTPGWVKENSDAIRRVYEKLEDDSSKQAFLSYIDARANCIESDMLCPLITLCTSKQYFNDLYPKNQFREHVLVDCGAFIGDTAVDFIDFIDDGKKTTVCAFEADAKNFLKLTEENKKHKEIVPYAYAVGDKEETLYMDGDGQSFSKLVDYETDQKIEVKRLDDVLLGTDYVPTYLKMDIEGSEIPALHGAEELIKRHMPMLGICVYHKLDDLISIPQLIFSLEEKSNVGKYYKYYLRPHSYATDELVFYAVPTER